MTTRRTLWVTAAMMAVALAGCTDSGSDTLDMVVTGGADPLADPFTFKATGPSFDQYTWDLGDGTILEGATVEHIYGFTDGDITVKLTGCTGGECESVLRKISLGGGKNVPPAGSLVATTNWAVVGEPFALDATGSTDSNGDPILYRWTCERLEDLRPPDDGGGHAHGPPGVPFGVNALATYDATLAGGEDHGADLCADFAIGVEQPWSRDTGTLTGTFAESGLYRIDVFVRDPKSAAWVGRLDLYVSETRPDAQTTLEFSGTVPGGLDGTVDEQCQDLEEQGGPECPTADRVTHEFTVDIPNELATVTFAGTGASGSTSWGIKAGETTIVAQTTESTKLLGALTFINGRTYTLVVEAEGPAINAPYEWSMVIENYLDPRHLYQTPP